MLDLILRLSRFKVLFEYLGVRLQEEVTDTLIVLDDLLKVVFLLYRVHPLYLILFKTLALVYLLPKLL